MPIEHAVEITLISVDHFNHDRAGFQNNRPMESFNDFDFNGFDLNKN